MPGLSKFEGGDPDDDRAHPRIADRVDLLDFTNRQNTRRRPHYFVSHTTIGFPAIRRMIDGSAPESVAQHAQGRDQTEIEFSLDVDVANAMIREQFAASPV